MQTAVLQATKAMLETGSEVLRWWDTVLCVT